VTKLYNSRGERNHQHNVRRSDDARSDLFFTRHDSEFAATAAAKGSGRYLAFRSRDRQPHETFAGGPLRAELGYACAAHSELPGRFLFLFYFFSPPVEASSIRISAARFNISCCICMFTGLDNRRELHLTPTSFAYGGVFFFIKPYLSCTF
jgi:hypothetical protein